MKRVHSVARRPRRSCWREARIRVGRKSAGKRNPATTLAAVLLAFTIILSRVVVAMMVSAVTRTGGGRDVGLRPPSDEDGGLSRPPTDYELGAGYLPPNRSPGAGRYGGRRPPMPRLIRDLRRPAARDEAGAAILALLPPGEAELRGWVVERIDRGEVASLALWARPNLSVEQITAGWRAAARRQAEEEEADNVLLSSLQEAALKGGPTPSHAAF